MKKVLRVLTAVGAASALAVPAAARAPRAAASRRHAVALQHISIVPKTLRIRRGDSVVWTWRDQAIRGWHNVTSYGKLRFRSSRTQIVGTYTVRFPRKGTYSYHCTIHDGAMVGKITVR